MKRRKAKKGKDEGAMDVDEDGDEKSRPQSKPKVEANDGEGDGPVKKQKIAWAAIHIDRKGVNEPSILQPSLRL